MLWQEVLITDREARRIMSLPFENVGPQDPELRNSPIIGEMDEDREFPRQNAPDPAQCYFNGQAYKHGKFIRSGTTALQCSNGVWVESGPGDPENP